MVVSDGWLGNVEYVVECSSFTVLVVWTAGVGLVVGWGVVVGRVPKHRDKKAKQFCWIKATSLLLFS